MEPANTIIALLGGPSAVARAVGVHRTRVANWKRPKIKGGTDGRVPQDHIPKLLEMASTHGVALSPADFFPAPEKARGQ